MLPGVCISDFPAGYAPHIIAHRDFVNLSLLEIRITQRRELGEIPATLWQSRWAPGISWSWARGRGAGTHVFEVGAERISSGYPMYQWVWQDPNLMEEL